MEATRLAERPCSAAIGITWASPVPAACVPPSDQPGTAVVEARFRQTIAPAREETVTRQCACAEAQQRRTTRFSHSQNVAVMLIDATGGLEPTTLGLPGVRPSAELSQAAP
jgi:hypothetical protein